MNNCVVIGGVGMVGTAVRYEFGIDKYFDLRESTVTLEEAAGYRYIFICLPTAIKNGRYETDDISNIIEQIADFGQQNVFIIKSTVFPNFAFNLMNKLRINNIISCPEFLTEATWKEDVSSPDVIVIGGRMENYIEDVVGIYQSRHKGATIYKTDNTTAELAKLAINGLYALKVVYANQIYDFAENVGANYERIKEIMYARKWVGKNHLDIWHKNGRGAGGKCLKKDFEALGEYSQLPLIKTAMGINNSYLSTSHKK
jgi:nucleotide sugar dehydrogenase